MFEQVILINFTRVFVTFFPNALQGEDYISEIPLFRNQIQSECDEVKVLYTHRVSGGNIKEK